MYSIIGLIGSILWVHAYMYIIVSIGGPCHSCYCRFCDSHLNKSSSACSVATIVYKQVLPVWKYNSLKKLFSMPYVVNVTQRKWSVMKCPAYLPEIDQVSSIQTLILGDCRAVVFIMSWALYTLHEPTTQLCINTGIVNHLDDSDGHPGG